MESANRHNTLPLFNAIVFVLFCLVIGQVMAVLATAWIYKTTYNEITNAIRLADISDKSTIITLALFSTLFGFIIVPGIYLWFTATLFVRRIFEHSKVKAVPMLLTILILVTLIPFITILIKVNHALVLPEWLGELEAYLKSSDQKARQTTNLILQFENIGDLIRAIVIAAIVPGIAEEFFFRGIVQTKLQLGKNHHVAILASAFLFSFFHFQFYDFLPKFLLGVLFGYIFFWSKSIWYPIAAHVSNNLIGVMGVYFIGPEVMKPQQGGEVYLGLMAVASVVISSVIIVKLKKLFTFKKDISAGAS